MRIARATLAAVLVCVGAQRTDAAEWQFKPFVGATYGSDTTFVLVQQGTARPHTAFGVNTLLLGEIFGLEADFGHTPGFFRDVDAALPLVTDSGVTTLTGNVVVALPRHLAQYTLRPYIVGGAGMMHVRVDFNGGLQNTSNLQAMDLGAGVTGFLTRRVGLSWDVRYFRSVDRTRENGFSITSEHLSFWRASMALSFRV